MRLSSDEQEDLVALRRVKQSPDKGVYYIDVTSIPTKEEVEQYIKKIKKSLKKRKFN